MNTTREDVYVVHAYERRDGIYIFRNLNDAEEFAEVLRVEGVPHNVTREFVCHRAETVKLIEAECEEG